MKIVGKYIYTLCHLKPIQIAYQIKTRISYPIKIKKIKERKEIQQINACIPEINTTYQYLSLVQK